MSLSGGPASDLLIDRSVDVGVADPESLSQVSVSGEASAVDDLAKLRRRRTKTASDWFPAGVDELDLALTEVRNLYARCRDMKVDKFTRLCDCAKVVVTGDSSPGIGEVGEVHIRPHTHQCARPNVCAWCNHRTNIA